MGAPAHPGLVVGVQEAEDARRYGGGAAGTGLAADAADEGRAEDVAAEGPAAGGEADERRDVRPRGDLGQEVGRKRRQRQRRRLGFFPAARFLPPPAAAVTW